MREEQNPEQLRVDDPRPPWWKVPGVPMADAFWFFAVSAVHLVLQVLVWSGVEGLLDYRNATKVVLLPTLALVAWRGLRAIRRDTGSLPAWTPLLWVALAFSWFGDIALIFDGYFLAGVGLFAVAQIAYTVIFVRSGDTRALRRPLLALPYLVWWGVLVAVIVATGDSAAFIAAVVAYGTLLGIMGFTAHAVSGPRTLAGVAIGAAIFLLSDSLIGIGTSGVEIPLQGFLVMLTYLTAQWLIVRGLLLHARPTAPATWPRLS